MSTNTTPMDDFQYSPLDDEVPCFRLLRLLPGDTKVDVECEIFHACISNCDVVPYEALSYTWGSTELVDCIKLNGQRLWITENLHTALLCLRSSDQDRILWIDAICIDQLNDEERSQQVQSMGTIFGLATRVIFWLGKPTADAVMLLESLRKLQLMSDSFAHRDSEIDRLFWEKLWSDVQEDSSRQDSHLVVQQQQRRGLQILLKRPWFRRVWILQEVANSQSAVVCSGMFAIPTHIFALAPLLLNLEPDSHVQSILDIMPGPARLNSWWTRERDLFSLITKFRASEATDIRDMIFALLGMSSEPLDHGLLRADYTKSVQEVFHNTIRYWFQTSSISIRQILHYLTGFETVHTTYLVPLYQGRSATEIEKEAIPMSIPHRWSYSTARGTVECIKDAALFLLEQRHDQVSGNEDACYAELNKLQSILDAGIDRPDSEYRQALHIVLWNSNKQNIRFLVVTNPVRALLIAGKEDCRRVFKFIAEKCSDDKQELLNRALRQASKEGCERTVQLSLDEGADSNNEDNSGDSVLCAASVAGHESILRMLLDAGADVNGGAKRYGTSLYQASESGHEQVVKILLEQGADVNAEGGAYGYALCAAARGGFIRVIQMLLDKGADVNARGRYGSALFVAISTGNERLVRWLLARGSDVNSVGFYYDPIRSSFVEATALEAASADKHEKVVQILLQHGAMSQEVAELPRQITSPSTGSVDS